MDPELLQRLLGQLGARPPGDTFGLEDAARMDTKATTAHKFLRHDLLQSDPGISKAVGMLDDLFSLDRHNDLLNYRTATILSDAKEAGLQTANSVADVAAGDSIASLMGMPGAPQGLPSTTKSGNSEVYRAIAERANRMRAERDSVNARRNRAYDARNRARADSMDSRMEARRDSARMEKMPLEVQLLSQFLSMFGDS